MPTDEIGPNGACTRAVTTPRTALLALLLGVGISLGSVGCRVNTDDLKRWQITEHGPDKLVAVLTHDKYEKELRVEAAWSLIEMKKRGGQAIGLTRLIEELNGLSTKERREIIDGLWKKLQPKVLQPIQPAGEGKYTDSSIVYKDATFSMYTDDKLDVDSKVRDEMTKALTEWAIGKESDSAEKRLSGYESRMDNAAQQYGVEQVLRKLGLAAATKLPALIAAKSAIKSQRLDAIARVVVDVKPQAGDTKGSEHYEKARDELSAQMAKILEGTVGSDYVESVREETIDALKKNPAGKQVLENAEASKKYFDKVRDDRLNYIFPIVKQVGRKAVVAQLMKIASDGGAQKEHRALSLAALEGNVDTTSDDALNAFLAIAKSPNCPDKPKPGEACAPDEVKHGALLRITAYPPERAVKAFYSLFDSPNWKVRYDGAMSILSIMLKAGEKSKTTPKEFLDKLPSRMWKDTGPAIAGEHKMGLGEPGAYGQTFSQLPKELNAKAAIMDALSGHNVGAQLTALGWFLSVGTKEDLPMLAKYESEKVAVPKCKDDDECGWDKPGCPVPKKDAKANEDPEWKPITTVGEYVQFCVKPQIEARAKAPASDK
jgi:hypothetical protein